MIDIRPLNPAHTSGDRDTLIGRFADSEWQDLIELARRYGFEPPNDENYLPRRYDEPIEIDAETSHGLLEAMSAVFNDDAIPPGVPSAAGRLGVRQLMEYGVCAARRRARRHRNPAQPRRGGLGDPHPTLPTSLF